MSFTESLNLFPCVQTSCFENLTKTDKLGLYKENSATDNDLILLVVSEPYFSIICNTNTVTGLHISTSQTSPLPRG